MVENTFHGLIGADWRMVHNPISRMNLDQKSPLGYKVKDDPCYGDFKVLKVFLIEPTIKACKEREIEIDGGLLNGRL